MWFCSSGELAALSSYCFKKGKMLTGKNVPGERAIIINASDDFVKGVRNRNGGSPDQLYRLIEYDEGVPFQLKPGGVPGDGCYLYVGNGIKKLTGIDPYAFTENTFNNMVEEIVPLSEELPSNISGLRNMLINGEIPDYRVEMKITTATGETKWLSETSLPVRDEKTGKVTGIMGVLRDISEKRRVLANLDEAKKKASEIEKLKTTFLQNISHEVRTPLNAIVGFSTLLCEPEAEYCRRKEFVSMINDSTDHFLEIMDNIMEIARIEAGSTAVVLSDVNIHHLMRRINRSFNSRAEDCNIQMICRIPEESNIVLKTDSFKLFQVLNNIISNAIKFAPSGTVEFGFSLTSGRIEFFVSDTGIGISDSDKLLVFNKFYQADSGSTRRFPGIGLGLTIARAYVEMLGGEIWCQSKLGEGSTFRFWLPS